jgi:hypothetical protein
LVTGKQHVFLNAANVPSGLIKVDFFFFFNILVTELFVERVGLWHETTGHALAVVSSSLLNQFG